jgi:hypothetical protein
MSLESIKLEKFYEKLPLCAAWLGFRRSGKSLSASLVVKYLVSRKAFKRVILFVGTKYCNPELCEMVKKKFDERLIFHRFSEDLLNKIILQQQELRAISEENTCLIIFDDIYTARGRHGAAMNKIFQSGRHFLISVFVMCVSWSDIAPSCRRSLDFVIMYSNITLTDTQFLTRCFLHRSLIEPARYALKTNKLYVGLCIETSPVQKLWLLKFSKKNSSGYKDKGLCTVDHSEKICQEVLASNEPQAEPVEDKEMESDEKTVVRI